MRKDKVEEAKQVLHLSMSRAQALAHGGTIYYEVASSFAQGLPHV